MSQFDYLQNLITNNPDGTVTIGGNTYATDGSGLVENYGGLTRDQLDAAEATVNDPFGTMAANAFMVPGPDGVNVFDPSGAPDDFSQLVISGGATPGDPIPIGFGDYDELGDNLITDDTITGGPAPVIGDDVVETNMLVPVIDDTVIGGDGTIDPIIGGPAPVIDPATLTNPDDIYNFLLENVGSAQAQNFRNQNGGSAAAYLNAFADTSINNNPTLSRQLRSMSQNFDQDAYDTSDYMTQRNAEVAEAIRLANLNNGVTDTTTTDTTTNTGPNYQDMYGNLVSEYQRLLEQQNQPTQPTQQPSSQTGSQDMSGLMGLLNQFMQSRNSLQGGGRYGNQYGSMYGGGMGGGMGYNSPYGNPFNSGQGYGYGMNPYSGGIGSFYGNTGLGFSPSGYNSGYGSGYGQNNMFYGGYGGNNYNQQQQMAYNPYSSLYNQLSNPQTYGYSGETYTPEYNSYLNTQYEGDKYSQGYQDYLQSNNPGVYNNLFGGSI